MNDAVRALVARTRAAQGLPPTIEDPEVLGYIAAVLDGGTLPARPGEVVDDLKVLDRRRKERAAAKLAAAMAEEGRAIARVRERWVADGIPAEVADILLTGNDPDRRAALAEVLDRVLAPETTAQVAMLNQNPVP